MFWCVEGTPIDNQQEAMALYGSQVSLVYGGPAVYGSPTSYVQGPAMANTVAPQRHGTRRCCM